MVDADIKFVWGRRRGTGLNNKDVAFYESFTYDGVEYSLFDSVYLYKEGESEPYIGKLIKIWEHSNKAKKIKVLWFFRPYEISNYLGVEKYSRNELFLASGEGPGLANINSVEAVAGKCNVVCISKDTRNPQPSVDALQVADFVFYRVFDVGRCAISGTIDEKIAGIHVKFLLNRVDGQFSSLTPKSGSSNKAVGGTGSTVDSSLILSNDRKSKTSKLQEVEKIKYINDVVESDERPGKKVKLDGLEIGVLLENEKQGFQKIGVEGEVDVEKTLNETGNGPFKKFKPDEKLMTTTNGKMPNILPPQDPLESDKLNTRVIEVTRKPEIDKSKWFKALPWEERIHSAHEQGTLILLYNLDPSFSSTEVEDIVFHALNESCTARMIPKMTFSSPHSGEALVIFKSRNAADMVIEKLKKNCLLLSTGRPLVARIPVLCSPGKQLFHGHLSIDNSKHQQRQEVKEAIATSHCSQPNTIEYDMAMDWRMLQEVSNLAWKKLYQLHKNEWTNLMATLKSK